MEHLLIKGPALVLGDAVTLEAGGGRQALVQVTDEEVVDIGNIQAVVLEVLELLEADGVVHRLDGGTLVEVVLAEDEQAHAVEPAVESARDLGNLALEDPAHRQGHLPVGHLLDTHVLAGAEAVGVAALEDAVKVLLGERPGEAGDVLEERQAGGLALLHRPRHLDAEPVAAGRLQVRPVQVHEPVEVVPENGGQLNLRVLLEEARVVFLGLEDLRIFRFDRHDTQM